MHQLLFSAYYAPSPVLGAGATRVSQTNTALGDLPVLSVQLLYPAYLSILSRKRFQPTLAEKPRPFHIIQEN